MTPDLSYPPLQTLAGGMVSGSMLTLVLLWLVGAFDRRSAVPDPQRRTVHSQHPKT